MVQFTRKTYIMLTFLWAFFILILSVIPGKDLPESNLVGIDKVVHFIFYFVLSFLYLSIFSDKYTFRIILIIAFICCAYGFLIECIQGLFLQDRFFDLYDVLANSSGVLFATFYTIFKLKKR